MTTPPGPMPAGGARPGPDHDQAGDDPEEYTPGLARERTSLAWTRTAISFAALGGVVLKANEVTGLIILALAPVIWQLGRMAWGSAPEASAPEASDRLPAVPVVGATRLFAIAVSITAVALLCLIVAIFGQSVPGALRCPAGACPRSAAWAFCTSRDKTWPSPPTRDWDSAGWPGSRPLPDPGI